MFGARRDSLKPSSLQLALRSLRNFSNAGVLVGEFAECRSQPSHKSLFSKINLLKQIPVIYIKSGGGIVPGWRRKSLRALYTTKPHGLGLGLGLSLSRSIVLARRGRLWAENKPTEGAIFRFTIPAWKDDLR
jgi:nitrogen-specific signal transduction histidine kinase